MNNNPLENIYRRSLLPGAHVRYLNSIKSINPKVIYDIGSCVLHWSRPAQNVWPQAKIIGFDTMEEARVLHERHNIDYYVAYLSDVNESRSFYKNVAHPGGQSFFQENPKISLAAAGLYNESHKVQVQTITLDSIVEKNNLPLPDLIKMDTQGSELLILKGAKNTLENCKDVILELQEIDWNMGAPKAEEVIRFMESIGFNCVARKFSQNIADADYHFKKRI